MKPLKQSLAIVGFLLALHCSAEFRDTVHLEPVVVSSAKLQYAPGSKFQSISTDAIQQSGADGLDKLIQLQAPIYIKSYASGISTISFRGTSPNHTQVLFNDETFNSLTLGHSNLCNIPTFFFDQIQVQYGGASSLYGSGAIGGTIHLNSVPQWNKGLGVTTQQEVGSFQNFFSGLKVFYGNNKWAGASKVFYKTAENNFPFSNANFKDFVTGELKTFYQNNAALENKGFMQEVYYRPNVKNNLALTYYYTSNWFESQPTMSTTIYGGKLDEIRNSYQRINLSYQLNPNKTWSWKSNVNVANDFQLYDQSDTIATTRYGFSSDIEGDVIKNGKLNIGVKYRNVEPNVHAYSANIEEYQYDLYASWLQTILNYSKISINIRNARVKGFAPQWAPSLGIQHRFKMSPFWVLDWKASVSKSYKIPTFNNRYWEPGGNPDLKTETGINYETGFVSQLATDKGMISTDISLFSMLVNNWIQWVPIPEKPGVWEPINFQTVHSKGIEWTASYQFEVHNWKYLFRGMYTFNIASPVKMNRNINNAQGKQMSYSPIHNAVAHFKVETKGWRFFSNLSYTGKRNNSTYDRELPGYILLDCLTGKSIEVKKSIFDISVSVNNLLNTAYINIENYAMPGINGRVNLIYKFNTIK